MVEGGWDTPYVPQSGHSGVTVATGVDLDSGPIDQSNFASYFPSYSDNPNLVWLFNAAQYHSLPNSQKLSQATS